MTTAATALTYDVFLVRNFLVCKFNWRCYEKCGGRRGPLKVDAI